LTNDPRSFRRDGAVSKFNKIRCATRFLDNRPARAFLTFDRSGTPPKLRALQNRGQERDQSRPESIENAGRCATKNTPTTISNGYVRRRWRICCRRVTSRE